MASRKGVCLVIGAGDGLGSAVARAFAAEGLTVCLTRRPRNLDRLEALAEEIRATGAAAHAFGCDAREEAEVIALFDRIVGPRGRGTLIFTGATASLRGREGFSAFAAAKAGLRALAQSLARELGPEGVHVAHVVIDGAVDGTFIRSIRGEVDDLLARDTILKPADVAATYVHLHRQPRSAWTHELDLRPWSETW